MIWYELWVNDENMNKNILWLQDKLDVIVSSRRENNKQLFCGEQPKVNLMINGTVTLEIKDDKRTDTGLTTDQFVLPSSCLAGRLIVCHCNPRGAVLGSHVRVAPWSESDLPNSQKSSDDEKWGKAKWWKSAKSWSLHDDCASSALLPKPDLTFTSSSTEIKWRVDQGQNVSCKDPSPCTTEQFEQIPRDPRYLITCQAIHLLHKRRQSVEDLPLQASLRGLVPREVNRPDLENSKMLSGIPHSHRLYKPAS